MQTVTVEIDERVTVPVAVAADEAEAWWRIIAELSQIGSEPYLTASLDCFGCWEASLMSKLVASDAEPVELCNASAVSNTDGLAMTVERLLHAAGEIDLASEVELKAG